MVQNFCTKSTPTSAPNREGNQCRFLAMSKSMHKAEVGRRLELAIEGLGLRPVDVAKTLGVSLSKIGNWFRGDNYPDPYLLTVFCDRCGVTTDFLYRGRIAGLPGDLADGLAAARAAGKEPDQAEARPVRGRSKTRH